MFRPVLTFLQAIAGIAWVPLAIIWFGIGNGAVIFVIANTIFFASIYNTVIGVQTIPNSLHRAVRSHGGRGVAGAHQLILPGALVQIILGFRTSMAYGWRALVAGEMIAGTNGLGYMTIEAVQWYHTDTIIIGMILIGVLWLILDRLMFRPLERATVVRWGAGAAVRTNGRARPLQPRQLGGIDRQLHQDPQRDRRIEHVLHVDDRARHRKGRDRAPPCRRHRAEAAVQVVDLARQQARHLRPEQREQLTRRRDRLLLGGRTALLAGRRCIG